jgi:hypothetical protein
MNVNVIKGVIKTKDSFILLFKKLEVFSIITKFKIGIL